MRWEKCHIPAFYSNLKQTNSVEVIQVLYRLYKTYFIHNSHRVTINTLKKSSKVNKAVCSLRCHHLT